MNNEKRSFFGLAALFCIMYFTSYITRINYGAVLVEIEQTEHLSKTLLSLAVTGSFVTYGVGQIVSGFFGDKFQPKALISYAFLLTAAMNVLIPFCNSPYQMAAVWCVNGFAQAFMWPPLVRLMSEVFTPDEYTKASVIVSYGSSFGTIAIYLISPVIISFFSWRTVFFVTAGAAVIMFFVWNKFCPKIKTAPIVKQVEQTSDKTNEHKRHPLLSVMMLFVMLAIISQGALRDGITTWLPNFISEAFTLGSEVSILSGAILPVFSILCFNLVSFLYRRNFSNNPLKCAGYIFCFGFLSVLCLLLTIGKNVFLSVFFSACITGSMHGVNWILICILPSHFKRFGKISTVSGVLNACTYIGSALFTYGIAIMCDSFGWNITIAVWAVIAAFGGFCCFTFAKKYKKRILMK